MAKLQLTLLKGDKVRNAVYREQLPVNMIAQAKEAFNSKGFMTQFFGITDLFDGQGIDRGAIYVTRVGFVGHYRVSGNSLIKINSDSATVIGDIPGDEQVSMAYSFNNLAIVADNKLFYYNPVDGLRQIQDPQIGEPIDIAWADSYFILTDGENIYHSTLVDEEEFDPLDFGTAEFIPDPSLGLAVNESDELVVFGQISTEIFTNTGGDNFAYTRIKQKAQKIGIISTHSKVEWNGAWFTLARRYETSPSFYILTIGAAKKIANVEVERILADYDEEELKNTTIDTYDIDGHSFIQFNLSRHTFVYNQTIAATFGNDSAWTIARSGDYDKPYRGVNIIRDPNLTEWVCGDKYDSKIGLMTSDIPTQYGQAQEWEMATPFVMLESLSIDQLSIETLPGFAPDNDATVAMSITYDGLTYSRERWQMYGKNYDYKQRFIIKRLGYVEDWCGFRFRGKTKSKMSFADFYIEVA